MEIKRCEFCDAVVNEKGDGHHSAECCDRGCCNCNDSTHGGTTCGISFIYANECLQERHRYWKPKQSPQPKEKPDNEQFLGEDRLMVLCAVDGLGEPVRGMYEIIDRKTGKALSPQSDSTFELEECLKNILIARDTDLCRQHNQAFEALAKPLVKYLNDNYNPHCSIIITCDSAEVVSGEMAFHTDEFIKD